MPLADVERRYGLIAVIERHGLTVRLYGHAMIEAHVVRVEYPWPIGGPGETRIGMCFPP